MKASKIIEQLEKQVARLKKFEDEEVSSFVIIIPPQGKHIDLLSMDADADALTFYKTLASRITQTMEDAQRDGVIVPGYRR
jgi:hypothetical protein